MKHDQPFSLGNSQHFFHADQLRAPELVKLLETRKAQLEGGQRHRDSREAQDVAAEIADLQAELADARTAAAELNCWAVFLHAQHALTKDELKLLKRYYEFEMISEENLALDETLTKLFRLIVVQCQRHADGNLCGYLH